MMLGVRASRIHEFVKERRTVTADTAQRVAVYFGGDAALRLARQADYGLKTSAARDDIARGVSPREAASAEFERIAGGYAPPPRASGLSPALMIGDRPERVGGQRPI
jgi:plasmid maintenance system antidote protein VapI